MAFLAWLFFRNIFASWISPAEADQYIAGCIILAAAPCTAMVFVWSYLADGDAAYTLVQVSVNDLIMLSKQRAHSLAAVIGKPAATGFLRRHIKIQKLHFKGLHYCFI
jgi:ACR3 family arsenite efflux pump ArsB